MQDRLSGYAPSPLVESALSQLQGLGEEHLRNLRNFTMLEAITRDALADSDAARHPAARGLQERIQRDPRGHGSFDIHGDRYALCLLRDNHIELGRIDGEKHTPTAEYAPGANLGGLHFSGNGRVLMNDSLVKYLVPRAHFVNVEDAFAGNAAPFATYRPPLSFGSFGLSAINHDGTRAAVATFGNYVRLLDLTRVGPNGSPAVLRDFKVGAPVSRLRLLERSDFLAIETEAPLGSGSNALGIVIDPMRQAVAAQDFRSVFRLRAVDAFGDPEIVVPPLPISR